MPEYLVMEVMALLTALEVVQLQVNNYKLTSTSAIKLDSVNCLSEVTGRTPRFDDM